MSTIKLLGTTQSTCTKRVLTVLHELNIDFEFSIIDFSKGEHKSPEFIEKYQPFGRVPVLVDGDFILFESRAIIKYLASKVNSDLYPNDLKKRAIIETWLSVESSEFSPAEGLTYEYVFKPLFFGLKTDEKVGEELLGKLNDFFKEFDKHLSQNKYTTGDNITLADLSFLPYLTILVQHPKFNNLLDSYSNISRWYKDISSRPSWQKVITLKDF